MTKPERPSLEDGNKEILLIAAQMKEDYSGDSWFGKSATVLLSEIDEEAVFQRPHDQHSILELIWHMAIWKEFTISRIKKEGGKNSAYFEANDWQALDHEDKSLWKQGLSQFHKMQQELVSLVLQQKDAFLNETVAERSYDFRKLLYGVVQHDIYHLGQIAYVQKMQKNKV